MYSPAAKKKRKAPLERRDVAVDFTVDIETDDLGGPFVMGGLYSSTGEYWEYHWPEEEEFVTHLFNLTGVIWAHFGGGYDYKWLLDHAAKRGIYVHPITAGSRIVCFQVGRAIFCDSFALVPIKLEEFTSGLSVSKQKLDLPCRCGKSCEGYCQITQHMNPRIRRRVAEYMRADCISLYQAMQHLRAFAAEHDLDLGITVGSSAWRELRRKYGIEENSLPPEMYFKLRAGYYGGRTELLQHGLITEGHRWDVASMYPWALATRSVPYGQPRNVYGRQARIAYSKGAPGFYRCIVSVPDTLHIPPLPVRKPEGGIAFPVGEISGTWPLPELVHAEKAGCSVYPIDAVIWPTELILFKDYVDKLFALRVRAPGGKSGSIGKWLKFRLNAPTGKMGSNPEKMHWEINPPVIRGCVCKCVQCRKVYQACDCLGRYKAPAKCKCRAHTQFSEYVYAFPVTRIESCARIEYAGYLTSNSRVHLREFLVYHRDGADVVMYDTDSCYRTDFIEHPNVGKELGQWDYEGRWRNFIGVAPKVYSYETEEGVLEARAKGIALPVRYEEKNGKTVKVYEERPLPGKPYSKMGVYGFRKGAAAGRFFAPDPIVRVLSVRYGSRVPTMEGRTRPPHITEIDNS